MKLKSVKERKERAVNDRKYARYLLRGSLSALLLMTVLYKLATNFLVMPLTRGVLSLAFHLSTLKFVDMDSLLRAVFSPFLMTAVLFNAVLLSVWNMFQISFLVNGLEFSRLGRDLTLKELFLDSMTSMRHVFQRKNLPILIYSSVIVPFANISLTTNFITQLSLPEYIMEVINTTPLYYYLFLALRVATIVLAVNLIFVFHYFILENRDFLDASRDSISLIRGNRIKAGFGVLLWSLRYALRVLFFTGIISLVAYGAVIYFGFLQRAVLICGSLVVEQMILPYTIFIFDVILTVANFAIISALYYRLADEKQQMKLEIEDPEEDTSTDELSEIRRVLMRKRRRLRGYIFPAMLFFVPLVAGVMVTSILAVVELTNGFVSDYISIQTKVTSHRGYSAVAPENTLASFQAAIDCGTAQYAELDVQMTSDGVVVLTHDTNLLRCTGRDVNVYDITYDELRQLDAGSYFSEEFAGERIPTLEEVIQQCKGKLKLNIEIKQNGHSPTLEAETVRIIRDNHFEDECVITSLDYSSLHKVKEVYPALRCGYIMNVAMGNYFDLPDADFFSMEYTFVTPNAIKQIHDRKKEVHVWTVDQSEHADKMVALGVDNIITGDPDLINFSVNHTINNTLFLDNLAEPVYYLLNRDWASLMDFMNRWDLSMLDKSGLPLSDA